MSQDARTTSLLMNKVPEATLSFWAIKVLSTTVGETGADFLAIRVGLGSVLTGLLVAVLLTGTLALQFRSRTYVPWIYWLTVVLLSIFGTQLTDALTDEAGVSLYLSTAFFSVFLIGVFGIWYRQEHTLSISTINTPRRESFYWLVILATFALGTAAGDLATEELGLGFRKGVVLFGALIGILATLRFSRANVVLLFWSAYILTRPLGASLGDLLSQSQEYGGLGHGALLTSAVFLLFISVLVGALTLNRNRRFNLEKK